MTGARPSGQRMTHDARCLAVLCAATVLGDESPLLAAQTNPGELMRAHVRLKRNHQTELIGE